MSKVENERAEGEGKPSVASIILDITVICGGQSEENFSFIDDGGADADNGKGETCLHHRGLAHSRPGLFSTAGRWFQSCFHIDIYVMIS